MVLCAGCGSRGAAPRRAAAPQHRPLPAPSSTTTPAPAPPFAVSETVLPLVDTTRPTIAGGVELSPHRALTTDVWIPDAPGRRPLIVFAPGFDVGPSAYQALLEAWARHGYIVAAPEFPLTDPAVAGSHLDEADIDNQPADVRFVTDSLVSPTSPLASRIDAGKVAVAGHSDGAETVLAASIDPVPAGEPRYRAVIAMSAQPLPGLASTPNPPILVTQGDADTINPPAYGYDTWQRAASPKYLEVLHGAGHLPPLQAGSKWLPAVEDVTIAFLDAYVAKDASPSSIASAGSDPPLASIQTG